jgi:CheY-like chemotaxis protein
VPTRVMMVDDNADDLLFTRIALKRSRVEYDIVEFERAEEALALLSDVAGHGIAIILLDINMPGMNGFDFLAAFEALPATQRRDVVVVMLTSSSDPADQVRAAQYACVRGFLNKPIDREIAAGLLKLIEQT